MRASIRFPVRRVLLLIVATFGLNYSLAIGTPGTAWAKVKPPVEMGDPDDTGNQGSVPGPTTRSKLDAFSSQPSKSLIPDGYGRPVTVLNFWNLARRSFALWFRAI